ncbi:hypothetical protein FM106_10170 [Brachybacterium faecium]|nr:hypothetical protein FM106_10170 [Brachybacterium faecium]
MGTPICSRIGVLRIPGPYGAAVPGAPAPALRPLALRRRIAR